MAKTLSNMNKIGRSNGWFHRKCLESITVVISSSQVLPLYPCFMLEIASFWISHISTILIEFNVHGRNSVEDSRTRRVLEEPSSVDPEECIQNDPNIYIYIHVYIYIYYDRVFMKINGPRCLTKNLWYVEIKVFKWLCMCSVVLCYHWLLKYFLLAKNLKVV